VDVAKYKQSYKLRKTVLQILLYLLIMYSYIYNITYFYKSQFIFFPTIYFLYVKLICKLFIYSFLLFIYTSNNNTITTISLFYVLIFFFFFFFFLLLQTNNSIPSFCYLFPLSVYFFLLLFTYFICYCSKRYLKKKLINL
jgi:hypothetical protein